MNREGQTEKWQSKELGNSYVQKSVMKVDRVFKNNHFRTLEINQRHTAI